MGICDYLRSQRVHFELLLHRPASSASRRAGTLHAPGRQVAKAVLLGAGSGYVLAVLPATHRIDLERLQKALGTVALRLASEPELDQVFVDCEHGALPPFGSRYGVPTIVDASLAGASEILVETNVRHLCLRLRYRDFEALEGGLRARFAVPAGLPGTKQSRRRAG